MGVIFSAFVWAYAIFHRVPGGWLSDRFGASRPVLAAIVAYWSVMTARTATAMATGSVSFFIIRFLFRSRRSRCVSGRHPRHAGLVPASGSAGLVQGLTHSASRLGAAIAPPIVVLIMTTLGWRSVFYICGAAGFLWSLWWYVSYRNLPEEHGLVNRAELQQIRGLDGAGEINQAMVEREGADVPWGTLLRSPNMWAIMCAYFTYVYCLYIFLTWLPSYLVDFRHFTLIKIGIFASLPLFAGVVGDTVGGLATDWLLKKTGSTRLARRSVAVVGLLCCAFFMVAAGMTEDAYTAVYSLTAAMFFLECTIGPAWAVPMDCGGKYSGTVSGMMNMAGNIGGALSPLVFGFLAQYENWGAPFIVSAALLVAGAGVWAFWLDPDKSVVERSEGVPIAAPATAV